jgi:nicotinate-nucleotide adenylyltransferase
LDVPRDAAGVVVFGGTFDPVHAWHTRVAAAARRAAFPGGKAWVVFVPAARSPFKEGGPVASDEDRVAMLRLATRRMRRVAIWPDEVERARGGEPSYMVETLERLRCVLPCVPMRLLIGADQAAAFHKWREYRRVMELAEPLVALRPPIGTPAKLRRALERAGVWSGPEVEAWMGRVLRAPVHDLSATRIRGRLGRGRSTEGELAAAVARYAARNGLYRRAAPRRVR